jgi:hypothetical protein
MTNEMMNLRTLAERAPDADILREMIGFAAERLMEMEAAALSGAVMAIRARSSLSSATAIGPAIGRRGPGRAAAPETAQGLIYSWLSGAAPDGREGAQRRDPGSLYPGRFDPLGRSASLWSNKITTAPKVLRRLSRSRSIRAHREQITRHSLIVPRRPRPITERQSCRKFIRACAAFAQLGRGLTTTTRISFR